MTRDQLILQLQQEYATRREENMRIYEEHVADACSHCPGLRKLLDARPCRTVIRYAQRALPGQEEYGSQRKITRIHGGI